MPPQPSSLLVLPLPRVVPSSANPSSTPMPTDPSPNSQPKQTRHSIRHRNGPRQADLNDGQEKLAAAFKGAHYLCTGRLLAEAGKAIVEAAAQIESPEHFIWSTLPDPVKLSGGRFMNVHHWKSKSLVTEYIQHEHLDLWAKTAAILFPNHFENCVDLPGMYFSTWDALRTYTLAFPHSPATVMPNVSIANTGVLVRAILEAGSTYFTKTIAFYSQALSEAEKLSAIKKQYNIPTQYRKTSAEEFKKLLESCYNMASDVALDFTEQLMIFEERGNVYARSECVQANEVSVPANKDTKSTKTRYGLDPWLVFTDLV
ncbi:hypothetical protein BJX68DRAFT_264243 [Aspergillus pseudodeflectus]|uniref:NmrA-like domain-containing protein n=1 Tax=Aspergillus pseudodeflectus TaxID=176178 RepID=A0ABR4KS40_9EURO